MASVTTERDAAPTPVEPIVVPVKAPAERFHQLDGLRAVACLVVVFHHSFGAISTAMKASGDPFVEYLGELLVATTGSGVELFFVLSGVVLLRPYVRGLRPFRPGRYFLRRIERLWPPYLAVLALEAGIRWFAMLHPTWFSAGSEIQFNLPDLAKLLPIVNFGSPFWNMAWWSLSVEVLFYLTVPLALPLFIWKRMNRVMMAILAVILWALGLYMLKGWVADKPAWYDSFQKLAIYSLCFLTGIAIAKFDWSTRTGWVLIGTGSIYLLSAIGYKPLNYHVGFAMLYGGLVIVAFAPQGALKRMLSKHLMVWIGERSYSLFLIHFTVFFAVNFLVSEVIGRKDLMYFIVTRAIGLPLALLAAMLLFQLVERRFARNLLTAEEFWPPLFSRSRAR
jgi:peptidoglycan/LPS O-acetylase OafA/YrhL